MDFIIDKCWKPVTDVTLVFIVPKRYLIISYNFHTILNFITPVNYVRQLVLRN